MSKLNTKITCLSVSILWNDLDLIIKNQKLSKTI